MRAFALSLSLLLLAPAAWAVPIFSEDFESDLSQWTGQFGGPHTGLIVDDPLRAGNRVLTFAALDSGGDLFSIASVDSLFWPPAS